MVNQTLEKPLMADEESRKSSTCHPGNISKYSDMLLVGPSPFTMGWELAILLAFESVNGEVMGWDLVIKFPDFLKLVTVSPLLVTEEEDGDG